MEKTLLKAIRDHFKDELLGMSGNGKELIVALKDKEVTIKDYLLKSVDEVIKEIKESE